MILIKISIFNLRIFEIIINFINFKEIHISIQSHIFHLRHLVKNKNHFHYNLY